MNFLPVMRLSALALALALIAACDSSNNEAVLAKQQREQLKAELKKMKFQLEEVYLEYDVLREEIKSLKNSMEVVSVGAPDDATLNRIKDDIVNRVLAQGGGGSLSAEDIKALEASVSRKVEESVSADIATLVQAGGSGMTPQDISKMEERIAAKLRKDVQVMVAALPRDSRSNSGSGAASSGSSGRATPPPSSPRAGGGASTSEARGSSGSGSGATLVSSPSRGGMYYTVKSEDTVSSIARAHGIDARLLRQKNNLPANSRLLAGQRLYIPRS